MIADRWGWIRWVQAEGTSCLARWRKAGVPSKGSGRCYGVEMGQQRAVGALPVQAGTAVADGAPVEPRDRQHAATGGGDPDFVRGLEFSPRDRADLPRERRRCRHKVQL